MTEPSQKPSGTIAVLLIYAVVSLILWGSVYLMLLLRGSTQ
jgi:flagellar basal body-associated protein FliL